MYAEQVHSTVQVGFTAQLMLDIVHVQQPDNVLRVRVVWIQKCEVVHQILSLENFDTHRVPHACRVTRLHITLTGANPVRTDLGTALSRHHSEMIQKLIFGKALLELERRVEALQHPSLGSGVHRTVHFDIIENQYVQLLRDRGTVGGSSSNALSTVLSYGLTHSIAVHGGSVSQIGDDLTGTDAIERLRQSIVDDCCVHSEHVHRNCNVTKSAGNAFGYC